jgi:hypothetical protein
MAEGAKINGKMGKTSVDGNNIGWFFLVAPSIPDIPRYVWVNTFGSNHSFTSQHWLSWITTVGWSNPSNGCK